MKFALSIIVLCSYLTSISAQRLVRIEGGRYNAAKGAIEIDVQYGGGCKKHDFELQMDICRKRRPFTCYAQFVDHTTDDYCEAFISETISIDLRQVGLDDSYYKGALLQIQGADNSMTQITLPN